MTYLDKLKSSAKKSGNCVCMGLDPIIDFMPGHLGNEINDMIANFFEELFNRITDRNLSPAAFKPNQGYYIRHDIPLQNDFSGTRALARVIKLCHEYFPGIPVIMDFKRGDIARSSHNYAVEGFQRWMSDAVTISPYMGCDSVSPFLEFSREGGGTYILNRTSNPGGKDFQNLKLENGKSLYQAVDEKIIEWNRDYPGTGAVVGATSMDELRNIAKDFSAESIPMLIPGVGAQGGSAKDVLCALKETNYDLEFARINSSSGLTHPWKSDIHIPGNWTDVSADALEKLIESCKI